jgi:hypothetical protein
MDRDDLVGALIIVVFLVLVACAVTGVFATVKGYYITIEPLETQYGEAGVGSVYLVKEDRRLGEDRTLGMFPNAGMAFKFMVGYRNEVRERD